MSDETFKEHIKETHMATYPEVGYPHHFDVGEVVQHQKTGGLYVIRSTPDQNVLEATWEPAYGYGDREDPRTPTIYRAQTEMEDGRFVPIE